MFIPALQREQAFSRCVAGVPRDAELIRMPLTQRTPVRLDSVALMGPVLYILYHTRFSSGCVNGQKINGLLDADCHPSAIRFRRLSHWISNIRVILYSQWLWCLFLVCGCTEEAPVLFKCKDTHTVPKANQHNERSFATWLLIVKVLYVHGLLCCTFEDKLKHCL